MQSLMMMGLVAVVVALSADAATVFEIGSSSDSPAPVQTTQAESAANEISLETSTPVQTMQGQSAAGYTLAHFEDAIHTIRYGTRGTSPIFNTEEGSRVRDRTLDINRPIWLRWIQHEFLMALCSSLSIVSMWFGIVLMRSYAGAGVSCTIFAFICAVIMPLAHWIEWPEENHAVRSDRLPRKIAFCAGLSKPLLLLIGTASIFIVRFGVVLMGLSATWCFLVGLIYLLFGYSLMFVAVVSLVFSQIGSPPERAV
uniref:Uncharacterized protein n=1 Tax=Spongospora subterranea TaxID=70186 RepID=A0A0H5QFE1_9EUKA|eukprot:CRZ00768.1 hypothetical protein [Spongospora subterranea]